MRIISAIARHDLRVILTDRSAVMWLFLMPVAFAVFMGLVMGGGGSAPDVRTRLTIVDADGGPVAAMLIAELADDRLALNPIEPSAAATTPDKIRTLIIPEGLSEAALAGTRTILRLEQDPGASVEAGLVAQARIVSAIATVIGRLAEARQSVEPGQSIDAEDLLALDVADDSVVIESRFAGEATVVPTGFAQAIPGNTVMFVLLVAMTYGAATISGERTGGQLHRLATTPATWAEIIAGKIVGRFAIAAVQITVLMTVAVLAGATLGLNLGDHPLSTWVVLLVYAAAVAPLGVAFGARFTDPDRAASVGVIATMVMAAFGGCWWPLEVVSRPLQTLALAFPTGWAMRALHGTISFGQTLGGLAAPLLALAGFSIVFTLIAIRSLRFD
jgi:ABC-type multidrug transport system permease subunit